MKTKRFLIIVVLLLITISYIISLRSSSEDNTPIAPNSPNAPPSPSFQPAVFFSSDTYQGLDIELTFWHETHDSPSAIWGPFVPFFNEAPIVERRPDDYIWHFVADVAGTFECYYWDNFEVDIFTTSTGDITVYRMSTTSPEIYSYRGIHIGSTMEAVIAAYPDAGLDFKEWAAELEAGVSDCFDYVLDEYQGSFAPILSFYFKNGIVASMELHYPAKATDEYTIRGIG